VCVSIRCLLITALVSHTLTDAQLLFSRFSTGAPSASLISFISAVCDASLVSSGRTGSLTPTYYSPASLWTHVYIQNRDVCSPAELQSLIHHCLSTTCRHKFRCHFYSFVHNCTCSNCGRTCSYRFGMFAQSNLLAGPAHVVHLDRGGGAYGVSLELA